MLCLRVVARVQLVSPRMRNGGMEYGVVERQYEQLTRRLHTAPTAVVVRMLIAAFLEFTFTS